MMYTCIILAVRLSENTVLQLNLKDGSTFSNFFDFAKYNYKDYNAKDYSKTEMKLLKSMNYDLQIVNSFETLHGLQELWKKTFNTQIDDKIKTELDQKQIKAHKHNTIFEHHMVMAAFSIFFEKFGKNEQWPIFNELVPYINKNALKETYLIQESLNKSIERDSKEKQTLKAQKSASEPLFLFRFPYVD